MTDNIEVTLDQRARTHGSFNTVSAIAQTIKRMVRDYPNGMNDTQKESVDMIASKIGRIVSGNPHDIDHWRDIEGYARLVRRDLERKEANKNRETKIDV